ncbi:MAG: DUF3871 family protein [Chitinophagaceae bacterium]|nr:DUF3871 family protein [Chitinophagaceae bacterium]
MELQLLNKPQHATNSHTDKITDIGKQNNTSTDKPFIQANTIEYSLEEIKNNHVIPVFIKDNEPVISHADFIETVQEVTQEIFTQETILSPSVRLSHPVKGRIPEAKNKPASELLEHEKTLYYERMAFVIEIPTVHDEIDGNKLSLTVGGVKALNQDNLYSKKGADEHFKIFIGFKNTVCTNLCIWTDGYMSNLKVTNTGQLKALIHTLFNNYNANFHLHTMRQLNEYSLTEQQFATLIGRCRMYTHLPKQMQTDIQPLQLGENQISAIVRDYYKDQSFCKEPDGSISLWKLYNLFTGANKSTYIDTFLDRSVNAFDFTDRLRMALKNESHNWFLH